MRVGIDAFPAVETRGGVGNYVRELLRALAALDNGDEFVAYVPRREPVAHTFGEGITGKVIWRETRRAGLRWRGALDALDLYHGTNFKMHTRGRYGAVLTIHDLWLDRYPQYSRKLFGQRLSSYRTRRRAGRAVRVIADSQHTAKDLAELYGFSKEKVTVIYPGASPGFFPETDRGAGATLRARYGIPAEPYVLFVGGADPRKNHRVVLESFAGSEDLRKACSLVAVGDPVHHFGSIAATARRFGVADRVLCTGSVSLEDLRGLYSHAALFVFPSLYEGFGFPVLEAMACGTPVVTSNRTSLPEVAGEAALLIDPEDPQALAAAVVRVLSDQALRQMMSAKGFERVTHFSWETTARETLQVYREVCGGS